MEKNCVYIKQSGEPPVPVTARIEWLPDGKIKPLSYWTPDGSLFQIKRIYEITPLAYLKDCGEGIRFKVMSVVDKTSEPFDERQNTRYETYLYLANDWFCGKNFIDERYNHAGKEYITVMLDVFPEGTYEIVYLLVQKKRYIVERTLVIEPRGSFSAGGIGVCHKAEVRLVNSEDDGDPDINNGIQRMAAIYFEINKWFVSLKTV